MIKINIELDYNNDSYSGALLALRELNKTINSIDDLFIAKVSTNIIEDVNDLFKDKVYPKVILDNEED